MRSFLISAACACIAFSATAAQPASGADTATRALIEELRLEEAPAPVRDWPQWRRPARVHIVIPADSEERRQEFLASAREVAGDVELVPLMLRFGEEPDPAVIAEMEVLLGACSPSILRHAVNLRWLQHYGAGVDNCSLQPEAADAKFLITNVQHTAGPPIAEHVIAMMMMLARGLPGYLRAQSEGRWDPRAAATPIREVAGKTLLVAGLGGIGTEVAQRAAALGMSVIATRRSRREAPPFVEQVGLPEELHMLAARADVVVNALPLTRETADLFDRRFFDAVKPGALFISIGRGGSTVTADLIAALRDGRLSGAGLDVTDPEPLPPDHELWTLPNVIITPHMSWMTDRGFERGWLVIRENLRRYINGEPLLNVVDLRRGY
jgi:D-2-hydroxyacid dehydrogenase (NADP+)